MKPILFPLNAAPSLELQFANNEVFELGVIEIRRFPDEESYVRLHTPVAGRPTVLLCSLDRPDPQFLPLLFAADASRRQGASQVGLVAPYLAYMRQDQEFLPGESVSAANFAAILSRHFDWLVTLEPHLHRIDDLSEIFTIPTMAVQATAPVGDWISSNIECPFLIGPDAESAGWIENIARRVGTDFAIFEKVRLGDRDVRIAGSLDHLSAESTPVVVDDIVSSGATMAAIVERIGRSTSSPTTYIAVHALATNTDIAAGDGGSRPQLISCNSVAHATNHIDVSRPLIEAVREQLRRHGTSS